MVTLDEDVVRFAPPEDVIIRKLEFFREGGSDKHLPDIGRMLASLGPEWDRATLGTLIEANGLRPEWEKIEG